MSKTQANHLKNETSPYLLQHAYNPVEWYPWGKTALEKAKKENKLILVSIGYAACHWCHVMEKESFENKQTAEFMNRHFVNIKIDREEYPDLDMYFMDVVQIVSGQGGWPLNAFLLPDGRPFLAGTYYPPVPVTGRPSWMQMLKGIVDTFANKPDVVHEQAQKIKQHIEGIDENLIADSSGFQEKDENRAEIYFRQLSESFDSEYGGFGDAPKFPQFTGLKLLLSTFQYGKNDEALEHVKLTLEKMLLGGIYDQCGGGLSRYAVDNEWKVPHFEKMLYDNALLCHLLADIYKITQDPFYKDYLEKTLCFVLAELQKDNQLFIASLDADSEGEEGLFYIWRWDELQDLLGKNLTLFARYFNLSPGGNWEGKNILHATERREVFADKEKIQLRDFDCMLTENLLRLFEKRSKRVRPAEDDKFIVSWNALMISALVNASEALEKEKYLEIAETTFENLLKKSFNKNEKSLNRLAATQNPSPTGCLDDYAYLIEAAVNLWNSTQKESYFNTAKELTDIGIDRFYDQGKALFWYAEKKKAQYNKIDFFDNAIPSSNGVMISNLLKLSSLSGNRDFYFMAEKAVQKIDLAVAKYTLAFSTSAMLLMNVENGIYEIVMPSEMQYLKNLNKYHINSRVVVQNSKKNAELFIHLLEGRQSEKDIQKFFLCKNGVCKKPLDSFEEMLETLHSEIKIID